MRRIREIIAIMILGLMLGYPCSHVEARSATDPVMEITTDAGTVSASVADANEYGKEHGAKADILELDGNMFAFVRDEYQKMDYTGKKDFMAKALRGVKQSGLPATTKSKVYNFISARDPSTSKVVAILAEDYSGNLTDANVTLKKWGVPQALSVILGILCIAVFAFMALSMVVDILYLNIPFVTMTLDSWGARTKKTGMDKQRRPKFVSNDGISAWRETSEGQANTNWTYLKKRFVSLLVVSLILVGLISGQLYTVIGNIVGFAQYILTLFGV